MNPCSPAEGGPHPECPGALGGRVPGEQRPAAPPRGPALPGDGVSEGEVSRGLCREHYWRRKGLCLCVCVRSVFYYLLLTVQIRLHRLFKFVKYIFCASLEGLPSRSAFSEYRTVTFLSHFA